jgi:hypothetical protein
MRIKAPRRPEELSAATITLNKPCGTIAGGVLTLRNLPLTTLGIGSGIAAAAEFTDSTGTIVADGLTNIQPLSAGDNVSVIAGTIYRSLKAMRGSRPLFSMCSSISSARRRHWSAEKA